MQHNLIIKLNIVSKFIFDFGTKYTLTVKGSTFCFQLADSFSELQMLFLKICAAQLKNDIWN